MRFASPALLERVREGATLVVPSRLLASVVNQQFTRAQLQSGASSWARPAVFTLDAWLTNWWVRARYVRPDVPALLSPSQERLLWRRIIEKEHPELFDPDAAARLAIQAATAICEWHIPTDGKDWQSGADSQEFLRLLNLFRKSCRSENWMPRAGIWSALPSWLAELQSISPQTILAGFDDVSPALREVTQAARGTISFEGAPSSRAGKQAPAKNLRDFAAEVEFAARWARAGFEAGIAQAIAVFVPDLAANNSLVERMFTQVFYPSFGLHNVRGTPLPDGGAVFRIDTPKRLEAHPLVASACLLLELLRARIGSGDASAILRNGLLAGAREERSARALADTELRKYRDLDLTLQDLEYASRNCPLLTAIWARVRKTLAGMTRRNELAAWSKLFADLLAAAGWPGDAQLTAEEQTIVELWKNSLSELSSLGAIAGEVTVETALSQFHELLASRRWEQGEVWSPVQILDAEDAPGLQFDSAIAIGLSEERWPPLVRPLPFIPLSLQRAGQLPGSDPASVRRHHERKTHGLLHSAPETIATFSDRLAPIARRFVRSGKRDLAAWPGTMPLDAYAVATLDSVVDNYAPAFQASEAAYGGTGVLKSQSLCPFRSFAENRLRATRPEDACFGFDARDRGSFLHYAMEQVWRELRDLKTLRALGRAELEQMVRSAITTAVADDKSSPLHQLSSETERHRLERLILDWLEIEKQRKHPFTAEHVEERRSFDVAGLHLRLRVDRIDRLDNGGVVLIDYKSGEQKARNLAGERPVEPQLMVYAAAVDERVEGVFFAQMKPRDLRAIGYSRTEHFPAKTKASGSARADWDEYLADSRSAVESLAADFMAGNAAVDPLPGACNFCNQKALCRVLEQSSKEDEDDGG